MDSNLLENFKQINNILKNRHEPINILQISKKLSLSIPQSRLILNYYISQGDFLNDYIVIFSAEILEANKIKTIILPSYSTKLNEIIENRNVLDFGVFAICKKEPDFILKDYSVFNYENELVENIKINRSAKRENNPKSAAPTTITNVSTSGSNKNLENKSNIQIKTITIKKEAESINSTYDNNKNNNNSANKSETSLSKDFNNKVNIKKEIICVESKAKQAAHNKKEEEKDLINSEHNISIDDIIANYVEINTDDKVKNTISNKIIEEENECYYDNPSSIFGGKGKVNNQKNLKKSNVIINYKPKQTNEDPKTNDDSSSKHAELTSQSFDLPVPEKRKRADSDSEFADNKSVQTKKKNESENLMTKNESKFGMREDLDSQNINGTPQVEESDVKKVKKIRKVKKTHTYLDEKGYLVTKDEWEDEEYWTDEKKKPCSIQQPILDKNKKAGNKKIAPGQFSIHSYFGK